MTAYKQLAKNLNDISRYLCMVIFLGGFCILLLLITFHYLTPDVITAEEQTTLSYHINAILSNEIVQRTSSFFLICSIVIFIAMHYLEK